MTGAGPKRRRVGGEEFLVVRVATVDGEKESGEKTTFWMYIKPVVNHGRFQLPTSTGERRISAVNSISWLYIKI